jgi:glutamyl/glutaminyl-tRNA synthetase
VSRSPAVFDEQKLSWMNGHYIRELDPQELARRVAEYMERERIPGAGHPQLERAVAAVQDKVSTLAEVPRLVGFAFGPVEIDERAWDKVMGKDAAPEALAAAREALVSVEPFDEQHLEQALRAVAERLGVKPGALFQPLRVALTGRTVSAGIFESLALLGREESLARVDAALARLPN